MPIVKAKAGERWALEKLKTASKAAITPLLEAPPIAKKNGQPTKSLADHIKDQCESLAKQWGTGHRFFFDLKWLHNQHGDAATSQAFTEARTQKLLPVPVIQPTSNAASLVAAKAIVALDKRGVMLRIRPADLQHPDAIAQAIQVVGLKPSDVDLLLDYRNHAMALPFDVPLVPDVAKWRTFTAASGVFPDSVSGYPSGIWHPVPRTCWTTWLSAMQSAMLPRIPTLGDYTVRSPGPPASGGDPPVTMRYTVASDWLVYHSGTLQKGHARRMHAICADLVSKKEFSKPIFSAGDQEIHNTATLVNTTPGGGQQWLQWAVSHHIEFVVAQLALLP